MEIGVDLEVVDQSMGFEHRQSRPRPSTFARGYAALDPARPCRGGQRRQSDIPTIEATDHSDIPSDLSGFFGFFGRKLGWPGFVCVSAPSPAVTISSNFGNCLRSINRAA